MRKHSIIVFVLSVVLATASFAQKQIPPKGGTPKDFTLPQKKTKRIANGFSYTLVPYGIVPKVTVNLVIKTGNVHETSNEIWLADLTGQLMKEGTTTLDFKAISKKAAAMGGNIDVSIGSDQITISGSVLSEFTPELVTLIGDIVINPAFPSTEIERLKKDLKMLLSISKIQPQAQANEKFYQTIYKDHPYGQYFPTEEMIDSYTVEKVKGFYEKNFGAKRAVLYVAGKFDEEKVEKSIIETFKNWTEGNEVLYPSIKQAETNEVVIVDRKDAPQTTIMIGLPTLTPKDNDYIALQITNSILGGSFGSRITSNLREDKGYTYSPYSVVINRATGSVWYEIADVSTEHTGASLQEIAKEIKRLQDEPPTKEELEGIQRYEAGIFVLQNSTPGGIINQLNLAEQHGLDDSNLTNRVKNIYAVTPEKVSEMAKNYFKYEDMTLVMVGDKKILEKQKLKFDNTKIVK